MAAAAAPLGAPRVQGFALTSVDNRVLTPNGDGKNDVVVFRFSNPEFSNVTGQIFDVRGRHVATMQPGPVADTTLQWDGRAGTRLAPTGVYIYVLSGEGQILRGTVVVIR